MAVTDLAAINARQPASNKAGSRIAGRVGVLNVPPFDICPGQASGRRESPVYVACRVGMCDAPAILAHQTAYVSQLAAQRGNPSYHAAGIGMEHFSLVNSNKAAQRVLDLRGNDLAG
ncbi:hypothetical protein D3C87_1863600 [compost metagenome]